MIENMSAFIPKSLFGKGIFHTMYTSNITFDQSFYTSTY